jgi:hypothetical protein
MCRAVLEDQPDGLVVRPVQRPGEPVGVAVVHILGGQADRLDDRVRAVDPVAEQAASPSMIRSPPSGSAGTGRGPVADVGAGAGGGDLGDQPAGQPHRRVVGIGA